MAKAEMIRKSTVIKKIERYRSVHEKLLEEHRENGSDDASKMYCRGVLSALKMLEDELSDDEELVSSR